MGSMMKMEMNTSKSTGKKKKRKKKKRRRKKKKEMMMTKKKELKKKMMMMMEMTKMEIKMVKMGTKKATIKNRHTRTMWW